MNCRYSELGSFQTTKISFPDACFESMKKNRRGLHGEDPKDMRI